MRSQLKCIVLALLLVVVAAPGCGDDDGSIVTAPNVGPDGDGDGWPESLDCDDDDSSIFPAADEIAGDGIDQNCSGSDDAGLGGAGGALPGSGGTDGNPDKWTDTDGDGWPAFADCADNDDAVFPNADEVAYDGIDQDCSGGDLSDLDGDGFDGGEKGDDCDDAVATKHPGSLEIALDGIDQDCDGSDLIGTDAFVPILPEAAEPGGVPTLLTGKDAAEKPVVLAVWPDSRTAPSQDIYARFLNASGKPVGGELAIAVGGLAKNNIRLATNGDSYLVTWQQVDGVWAQQLTNAGELEGSLLGVAPADSVGPHVAWGGSNWSVAWANDAGEVRCRGVSTDGVRSDIYPVASPGSQQSPTLAGGDDGFLVAWAATNGIRGHLLDGTSQPTSDEVVISSEPNVAFPEALSSGGKYFVAFSRGVGTVSIRGQFVSFDAMVKDAASSLRLSSDTFGAFDILVTPTASGLFTAWNDSRHQLGVPAYGAIYGNAVSSSGALSWEAGAGLHVDLTAQLGGVATIGDNVLVSSRVGSIVGVVVRKLP